MESANEDWELDEWYSYEIMKVIQSGKALKHQPNMQQCMALDIGWKDVAIEATTEDPRYGYQAERSLQYRGRKPPPKVAKDPWFDTDWTYTVHLHNVNHHRKILPCSSVEFVYLGPLHLRVEPIEVIARYNPDFYSYLERVAKITQEKMATQHEIRLEAVFSEVVDYTGIDGWRRRKIDQIYSEAGGLSFRKPIKARRSRNSHIPLRIRDRVEKERAEKFLENLF